MHVLRAKSTCVLCCSSLTSPSTHPSTHPSRVYVRCLDPGASPCTWDEFGRRICQLEEAEDACGARGPGSERRYNYGGPPGSGKHELLTEAAFEVRRSSRPDSPWAPVSSAVPEAGILTACIFAACILAACVLAACVLVACVLVACILMT